MILFMDVLNTIMKNEAVEILNKSSSLPLNLLLPYSEFKDMLKSEKILSGEYIDNYMSFDYYYEDYFVSFLGYPNDECNFYLTHVKFNSYNYHIFYITIGDRIDCAEKILSKYGYQKFNNEISDFMGVTRKDIYYQLNDVQIRFELNNNIIKEIEIYVKSEYLGNRIY